jgi:UDP-glucose 4-epimerase
MAILLTGGAGYIGSIIGERLSDLTRDVVVLDNLAQGHRDAICEGVTFVDGDIGDSATVEEIFRRYRVTAVIHMAAETVIARSMTDPGRFFRENVWKGTSLLDSMLRCGVDRIVFSSSAAVYGEPHEVPIAEGHSQNPINPYGESKRAFERVLHWYHEAHALKYVALRYFNAAGASGRFGEDHDPESHLVPLVLQAALGRRDHVDVYGRDYDTSDGTCVRDFVHVIDLAEAHLLALEAIDRVGSGVYNLGSGEGHSVLEVIECARRITGRRIPLVEAERRVGDPAVLVANPARAKRELLWEPKHQDLYEIVQSAWEWHRAHPDGYGS